MCEYKKYCENQDCDGYPEESELHYCWDAMFDKSYDDIIKDKEN